MLDNRFYELLLGQDPGFDVNKFLPIVQEYDFSYCFNFANLTSLIGSL